MRGSAIWVKRFEGVESYHSSRGGGEDLSYGAGILVGEQVDGGKGPVDYHSQDKDDHQGDLKMITVMVTLIRTSKRICAIYKKDHTFGHP